MALSIIAQAGDNPNAQHEGKLFETYKTYHDRPTSDQEWYVVRGNAGALTYKVQSGETLEEVSEVLFGDPSFWPKIWSLNKEITNPYEIRPGTIVKFYSGSASKPPSISMEAGKEGDEISVDVLAATLNVEIPEPSREKKPALKDLPASVPFWNYKKKPKTSVELSKVPRSFGHGKTPLGYFIADKGFERQGEVVSNEMGMSSAGDFQYIYVKVDGADEKNYLVIKDMGEIKDPYTKRSGRVIQIQGEISVGQSVGRGVYRAFVRKAIHPIEAGAALVVGSIPRIDAKGKASNSSAVSSRVIGGEFDVERRILGPHGVIFLNSGASDGVSIGQVLPLFRYEGARNSSNLVRENPRKIASVKIVKTSDRFSTGIITESTEEIQIGDGTSPDSVLSGR
ncbi:MAG: hypothetical protein BroJett040_03120 [Oligoflexia bacterium]|nr:MAG: hypothetical protein BroJett040_03120 [Oligoflexia bacterium]